MWKKYRKSLSKPESYVSMGLGLLVVLVAGMLIFNFIKRPNSTSAPTQNQVTNTTNMEEANLTQPVLNLPASYTVEAGDNLWTIAEKYYHSGYNWVTIAENNKLADPGFIEVGQKLKLPTAETITPLTQVTTNNQVTQPSKIEAKAYTVVKGDDLWDIAVRTYGDGYAWVKIAKANKLVNPNIIHPGNVLTLPR